MGSGHGKYLYLLDKVLNAPIFKGLKRCFWLQNYQFKAVLIFKRYFTDAIAPPLRLENEKFHSSLPGGVMEEGPFT